MKKVGAAILLVVLLFSLQNVSAKMVNCKEDRGCFLEYAENCERSQLTTKEEFWFFGLIITSENIMKIRGEDSGKCAVYIKNKKVKAELDREFIQSLSDEEITEKEFRLIERQINGVAKRSIQGKDMICKFNDAEAFMNYINEEEVLSEESYPDCVGALNYGVNGFQHVGPVGR